MIRLAALATCLLIAANANSLGQGIGPYPGSASVPAGNLTGSTLAPNVTSSSLTSFGNAPTANNLKVLGSFLATGLVTNSDLVSPSLTINTTSCTLGLSCTISTAVTGVDIGTTTVLSGTSGYLLYDNSGVLGNLATTGSGNAVLSTGPAVANLTVTGAFTATGLVTNSDLAGSIASSKLIGTDITTVGTITTGTWHGSVIAATYLPTASNSTLGLAECDNVTITCSSGVITSIGSSATNIAVGTTTLSSGTPNGLLYNNGAVVGNLATANNGVLVTNGSGVPSVSTTLPSGLSAPSLTVTSGFTATGLVTNSDLVNSATTVNGQTCTLGSTCTVTSTTASIQIGVTGVASGSAGYLLYNNSGTLGNLGITGSGLAVLSASPTFTGVPVAPTASTGTNTVQLATTQFVQNANFWSASGSNIANNNGGTVTIGSNLYFTGLASAGGTQFLCINSGSGSEVLVAAICGGNGVSGTGAFILDTGATLTNPNLSLGSGAGNQYVCYTAPGPSSPTTSGTSCNPSDARMKQIIGLAPGLDAMLELHGWKYNWLDVYQAKDGEQIGLIAQEVQKVIPDLVRDDGTRTITLADGEKKILSHTLTLDYPHFAAVTVNSFSDMQKEIVELKTKLTRLEREINP